MHDEHLFNMGLRTASPDGLRCGNARSRGCGPGSLRSARRLSFYAERHKALTEGAAFMEHCAKDRSEELPQGPLINKANHVDFVTGFDAVLADLHNPCCISQKEHRTGPFLHRSSDPRAAAGRERHAKLTGFPCRDIARERRPHRFFGEFDAASRRNERQHDTLSNHHCSERVSGKPDNRASVEFSGNEGTRVQTDTACRRRSMSPLKRKSFARPAACISLRRAQKLSLIHI